MRLLDFHPVTGKKYYNPLGLQKTFTRNDYRDGVNKGETYTLVIEARNATVCLFNRTLNLPVTEESFSRKEGRLILLNSFVTWVDTDTYDIRVKSKGIGSVYGVELIIPKADKLSPLLTRLAKFWGF